jgi:hypothetical protein
MVKCLAVVLVAFAFCVVVPSPASAVVGIVGAQTSLPQGPYRFGEQVTAELDTLVNTTLVDPSAVSANVHFDPYELVSSPERHTLHEGPVARVRFRYLIQCASIACTLGPTKRQRRITFRPAVLAYTTRDGKERTTKVRWQSIVLVTRVDDPASRRQSATQVRLPTVPIEPLLRLPLSVRAPPPSYRTGPSTLGLALILAALVALAGAGVVARPLLVLVRRGEVEGPPLPPLEQALLAVETAGRRQPGSAEHREALGLLARQLRRANLNELVNRARRLAWSEDPPTASDSLALTGDVRSRMESSG